jgi:hypothetical protein
LHPLGKPEAEERECDEKWWSCFEFNQWIHRYFLSVSPLS